MPGKETDVGTLYLGLEDERSWFGLLECWKQIEKEFPSDTENCAGARRKWYSLLH